MAYPAVKLHKLYSLNLYEGIDIIFEDLGMINFAALEEVVKTKPEGSIQLVENILTINTSNKSITIVGNMINASTYIVNKRGGGDITLLTYKCPNENIFTAIEYLYHMYKYLAKGA